MTDRFLNSNSENGGSNDGLSRVNELITQADSDPKLAANLEALTLRRYAAGVFTVCGEELGRIYTAYKERYESSAGTRPEDLTQATEEITNMLRILKEQIEIDPILKADDPSDRASLRLLEQKVLFMDETEQAELEDLANGSFPDGDADSTRQRSLETREGVTEVLWELASVFKEDAVTFQDAIPKDQQEELFAEFSQAYDLSSRELTETAEWMRQTASADAQNVGTNG